MAALQLGHCVVYKSAAYNGTVILHLYLGCKSMSQQLLCMHLHCDYQILSLAI